MLPKPKWNCRKHLVSAAVLLMLPGGARVTTAQVPVVQDSLGQGSRNVSNSQTPPAAQDSILIRGTSRKIAIPRRNRLGLPPEGFSALQTQLPSQDSVRVAGVFGDVVVCRPRLTTDSLHATSAYGLPAAHLDLNDVSRIQVQGGASGAGALIGGGIGFLVGLVVGLGNFFESGVVGVLCDAVGSNSPDCNNDGSDSVVVIAGSTAAGALLGALVGSQSRSWHTVYPDESEPGIRPGQYR